MAAGIPKVPATENVSTTLSAGITDSAGTMSVADASNLTFPCYLVIDRVDAAGTVKDTSLWEYVKVTNITGNDLTITRGQGGSTQQSHSSGAVVEAVITAAHFSEWYDVLNPEHTVSGGHILGTATVSTHLAAGNASVTGINLGVFPTFVMPNNASAATVSIGKPLTIPRAGTARFVNVTLRAPVSAASIVWDVNKNYTSIFDAGTRPSILGGGTFVSTASIATSNFKAGDTISVDLDVGGEFKDATLIIGMY